MPDHRKDETPGGGFEIPTGSGSGARHGHHHAGGSGRHRGERRFRCLPMLVAPALPALVVMIISRLVRRRPR